MSKADKAANRAHIKAQQQTWNHMAPAPLRVVPPATTSWWTEAAAPDADAKFTELARERNRSKWSNVVPHSMNPRGEFV